MWVTDDVACPGRAVLDERAGPGSLVMVQRTRQGPGDARGRVTPGRHCYPSRRRGGPAGRAGRRARGHGSVEGRLHRRLDVCVGEDDSRLREGHGAADMSRLRRTVPNQPKADRSQKRPSLKDKRYRCPPDRPYLTDLLQQ